MSYKNPSTYNYLTILFEWEGLTIDKLRELSSTLSSKMLRWLAMIHPDNMTRENLLRFSNLQIGKNTIINIGINVYNASDDVVEIGNNCDIAANVSLITESGVLMSELKDIPYIKDNYIKQGKIKIEDHVWIGANVIVFPGVTIGHHSIIGAGSIITRDIPPNSIAKGQPGKVFKVIRDRNVFPVL